MFAIWAYDTFHDGAAVIVVALYGGIFSYAHTYPHMEMQPIYNVRHLVESSSHAK